jgi:hypothetical protein
MDNWNITTFLYVYFKFPFTLQTHQGDKNQWKIIILIPEDTYLNTFLAGYSITVTICHFLIVK